jgi:WD40 repeat protein
MRAYLSGLLIALTVLTIVADGRPALAAPGSPAALPSSVRAVPLGAEPIFPENVDRVGQLARWGNGEVRKMVYSADGSTLAVGTWVGIAVFDTATNTQTRFLDAGATVGDVALASDGSVVAAVVSGAPGSVRLWRVSDGAVLGQVQADLVVAISQDNQYVAGATGRGRFTIWRMADLAPVREVTLTAPYESTFATSLAFSPDGQLLAVGAGSPAAVIGVLRIEDGTQLHLLRGHTSFVNQVQFSPDGQSLSSSSSDGSVRLWSLADGSVSRTFQMPQRSTARLSPDWSTALMSVKGDMSLLRASDGTVAAKLPTTSWRYLNVAAFSPDGATVATMSAPDDEVVRLWRVADGAPIGELPGFAPEIVAAGIAPDGQTIATATTRTVRIQRLSDGAIVNVLDGVSAIGFSPDGRVMATWDHQPDQEPVSVSRIALRRLPDGAPISTVEGHLPVAFSPDGSIVVTSSGAWRVEDGVPVHGTGCSFAAAISPDGATLACALTDGGLRLHRLADGAELTTLEGHRGPELRGRLRSAESLAFSADGRFLLSGAQDGHSQLWRLDDGTKLGDMAPGHDRVKPVAFVPDGRTAVVGTQEGHLVVWPLGDGATPAPKPLLRKSHSTALTWMGVTPDGTTIVTAAGDGTLVFWGVQ